MRNCIVIKTNMCRNRIKGICKICHQKCPDILKYKGIKTNVPCSLAGYEIETRNLKGGDYSES